MVIDPQLNAWYDNLFGVEVGDVCIYSGECPSPAAATTSSAKGNHHAREVVGKTRICQPKF